jgi:alanine racemase
VGTDSGFDPWIEIDASALRHNAAEVSRVVGGRPILALLKNNAYGLGDTAMAPILASCPEVSGIACVRVAEALAMRRAGVTKPILNMAEVSESTKLQSPPNLNAFLPRRVV